MSGVFSYDSETEGYYVWSFHEDREKSKLYIARWRVPNPIPRTVEVFAKFADEHEIERVITRRSFGMDPEQKREPIVRFARRVSCHTNTIRFDTYGWDRPFNTIYVPLSWLEGHEDEKEMQVIVRWGKGIVQP